MKQLRWTILLATAMSVVFFTGCNDDDDDKSAAEMLVGTWKVISQTIDPAADMGSGPITDMYSIMEACEKDDLTTFKSDGTFINDEGATKCDTEDPQTEEGTWKLIDGDKKLVIDSDGAGEDEADTLNLSSISDDQAVLQMMMPMNGTDYTITMTVKKQ